MELVLSLICKAEVYKLPVSFIIIWLIAPGVCVNVRIGRKWAYLVVWPVHSCGESCLRTNLYKPNTRLNLPFAQTMAKVVSLEPSAWDGQSYFSCAVWNLSSTNIDHISLAHVRILLLKITYPMISTFSASHFNNEHKGTRVTQITSSKKSKLD
jgi:hypothetical protein